jgi:hypothetical protein
MKIIATTCQAIIGGMDGSCDFPLGFIIGSWGAERDGGIWPIVATSAGTMICRDILTVSSWTC